MAGMRCHSVTSVGIKDAGMQGGRGKDADVRHCLPDANAALKSDRKVAVISGQWR